MEMMIRLLGAAAVLIAAVGAATAACRPDDFRGTDYTLCSFDLNETDLRMFWRRADGAPHRTFASLRDELEDQGLRLGFAMNGGMYAGDLSPIGLYVEEGQEIRPANTASVREKPEPNFYKKPNGIFYLAADGAGILETSAFLDRRPDVTYATQSGPMLVIDGEIHPAFIVGSTDRKMRNGVGVCGPGKVSFAISEGRVNFDDFARYFRDKLGCDNALFLDGGSAPGLYSPELGREDRPGHGGYGPIIGAVEP
jgi:uncharacterized protein YigE (DUF2233 family)